MSKFRGAIGALVALVGLALVGGGLWYINASTSPDSYYGCDKFNQAITATEGLIAQTLPGAEHDQMEQHVKDLAELRLQAQDDGCSPTDNVATTSATSPTATASASAGADAGKKAGDQSWTPHYFTLDQGKQSERAFGPPVKGGAKAANGSKTARGKIIDEFKERMLKDPSLLCGNGGLILDGKDGGKDCVDKLLKSKSARDKYYDRAFDEIKSTRVEKRYAQSVESAYMVVPKDGVPRIVKIDTYRSEVYYVLVVKTKAGKTYNFRLECGFQWDTGRKVVPRTYTPVPHSPYTPVVGCVNGGHRDGGGSCVPPSGGCKHHCNSTTPPPRCRNKECETPVTPPGNRPKPTSEPTRSPETKAPAGPSQPASTATPTVKASGASEPPKATEPVPTVKATEPADGDHDPDEG